MALRVVDPEENKRRMTNGDLYFAFTPDLIADRKKCRQAYEHFNTVGEAPRRTLIELFQKIVNDKTPLPPQAATLEDDEDLLGDFPWIDRPVKMDYGYNVKVGNSVYINSNSTWIDTCTITIGARTLIGPNCSFFSGNHPTDPRVRSGMNGPEDGAPITIGEDCWLGGNVIVLRGVTIGRGSTVGAGSVVTKDIPPFMVAAGNPARVLKPIRKVPVEELPPGWSPPENIPNSET